MSSQLAWPVLEFLAEVDYRLMKRDAAVRAAAISLLTRPLGFLKRVGDRVGVRLVRPAL